jgi:predicted CXXCH cytochrome family protein
LCIAISSAFAFSVWRGERAWLLPGQTSDGHHVIDAACDQCHEGFAPPQNARCIGCHGAELRDDTHPVETFEDPRWAAERELVDARHCISCHGEHARKPRGVTAGRDLCVLCHDDVLQKRENHRGLARGSCMNGGCHNYHDNSALSSAFITEQLAHPPATRSAFPLDFRSPRALPATREVPRAVSRNRERTIAWRWEQSAHARNDVACRTCHEREGEHVARPDETACESCHAFELDGFRHGKHGARGAVGLPPLRPEEARLPMNSGAHGSALGCATCHDPHALDVDYAATSACLGCHADEHSRAFASSPHARAEVTCATCHLPRIEVDTADGRGRVAVVHNNSLTLAPRDRMAAMVCVKCHAIDLALSALFDEASVRSNFTLPAARVHPSIDMACTAPGP